MRRIGPALGLVGLHLALGLWSILHSSATFDEPMHIAAGYSYWATGDWRMDPNNPPLAKLLVSLPLAPRNLSLPLETREWQGGFHYAFGERWLYWSGNDPDALLLESRLVNLILSCVLGLVLWRRCRAAWGEKAAFFALACYALSPNIVAHSSLATHDFPAAFFSILGVLALWDFLDNPSPRAALRMTGAATLAFLCNYSALLLPPIYLTATLWRFGRQRFDPMALRNLWMWAIVPWAIAAGSFLYFFPHAWDGFSTRMWQVSRGSHPTFLLGSHSDGGSLWYYAVALLTKSTVPELIVLGAGLWHALRRGWLGRPAVLAALLSILIYCVAGTLSRKQIGLRYILPTYPLIALLAAPLAREALKSRRTAALAWGLAAWHALGAAWMAPQYLAYFNEFAGGPSNGFRILGDSNIDWGQDLKALGTFLRKEGSPEVVLSYFGTAAAEHHGIRAQQILSHNAIQRRWRNSDNPRREYLVVSATNLQGVYRAHSPNLTWLSAWRPLRRVGYSLFVYDATKDAKLHRLLSATYAALGDKLLADREARRAEALEKS